MNLYYTSNRLIEDRLKSLTEKARKYNDLLNEMHEVQNSIIDEMKELQCRQEDIDRLLYAYNQENNYAEQVLELDNSYLDFLKGIYESWNCVDNTSRDKVFL